MGNSQNKFQQKFSLKYQFVDFFKDANFGPIKIYRKKEPCYDYAMIVSKVIDPEQKQIYKQEIQYLQRCFRKQEEPAFLRIFGYQFAEDNKAVNCSQSIKIKIYMEYLNYTLKDLISFRQEQGIFFSSDQINFILWNCLKIYDQYQNLQIATLSFRSSCIFITPEGYIKLSPIKNNQDQSDDIACNGITKCYPTKIVKQFKKSRKQFIFQFKKLLHQLTKSNYSTSFEAQSMFKLTKAINSVNHIQDLFKILQFPKIQKLFLSKKDHNQFNQRSQARIKDSPLGTRSEISVNSKLSLKNGLKANIYFQNVR